MKQCLICQGQTAGMCAFCGWRAIHPRKPKLSSKRAPAISEEEKQRRKRCDFLGRIYNGMRKFKMATTGLIGKYREQSVILCHERHEDKSLVTVLLNDQRLVVAKAEVTEVQQSNLVDEEIRQTIGMNPRSEDSEEYIPYYKDKKNEV